jgi:hypothetical protein
VKHGWEAASDVGAESRGRLETGVNEREVVEEVEIEIERENN